MESNIADEIIPRLWLGNAKASMDEEFIRRNNITAVFNCTKNLPFSPIIPIKYRVPVDDNLEEEEIRNMELWSTEISYKIIKEHKPKNVPDGEWFSHCYIIVDDNGSVCTVSAKHFWTLE